MEKQEYRIMECYGEFMIEVKEKYIKRIRVSNGTNFFNRPKTKIIEKEVEEWYFVNYIGNSMRLLYSSQDVPKYKTLEEAKQKVKNIQKWKESGKVYHKID